MLPTLTQSKIRELQTSGEKPNLDYKLRYDLKVDDVKNELAKDASAIANFLYQTSGQGYLIIGLNDDGTIVGVNPRDYKEERIQQIISGRTDPPPIFTVHQVTYSGVNLVVITFRRNPFGPHQVIVNTKPAGFPIRRGTTTATMTTNEVFQAMQTRGRSFTRQRSEYETLTSHLRSGKIIEDFKAGLTELGINQNSIREIDFSGGHAEGGYYRPVKFLRIIKVINSKKWNFYFSFLPDNAVEDQLLSQNHSITGFIRTKKLHRNNLIFISIIHGSLSETVFSKIQRNWSGFILIKIEPNITYFGLGEGKQGNHYVVDELLPKFFVHNVKSKEDLKARVELIIRWVEQHQQLFNDIELAFEKELPK